MEATDIDQRRARLAWVLGGLWLLLWIATVALLIANRSAIKTVAEADPVDVVLPIGFAVIGTLLASRKPSNPTGWIFLGIAALVSISGVITQYVFRSFHFEPLPLTPWVAWAADPLNWVVFPTGLAAFFFLLFPDGHLPSRRWRWLAWLAALMTCIGFLLLVFQKAISLAGSPEIPNPLGSIATVDMENGAPGLIWLFGIGVIVAAMAGTVVRTRRSSGELRQQLRWLGFASALTAIAIVALITAFFIGFQPPDTAFDFIILLGYGVAVPVACGIAILKHGLYDLDVVINKTVVYALLAAFFTVVYLAIVVGIGTAIGSSNNNSFLTVLAAATIAVAFNPVRDRAKRLANRIVYGKRASPYEVLSEFSERVGGTYSVEDVLPRMATLLGKSTGAREATVWLRVGAELRPSASWGSGEAIREPLPMSDGELPAFDDASKVAAVRDREELLGALTVTKPPNDPLTVAEDKLVNDLAAQAGLVLRNVRLTEELRANLEQLQASRQRLVTAQDGERRRIERNIHDGVQQQLVAMNVQLGLLARLAAANPRVGEMATALQARATEALEDLRDLARGIYPPLLADRGLAAALEAQARKAAVPVTVEAGEIGRFSQDVEATVYFCALEALNNVAKYADASHTTVRLTHEAGGVRFEVADDGRGFDPPTTSYGTGLQGMADRLAALGGELAIASESGRGTRVVGTLPIGP
jgi:signal transduction histidine kinase